jgi:hypothetical protein
MTEDLARLKSEIEREGYFTTAAPLINGLPRLVCASHRDEHGLRGNSLWIRRVGGRWQIGLWSCRLYQLSGSADVAAVCVACLRLSSAPLTALPEAFMQQHGIGEIPLE